MNNFFNPKTIAVIGASDDPNKVGYAVLKNLLVNTSAKVFPVSLENTEIQGQKVYKSIKDISENIDLAVIAVRADIVPNIIEECGSRGAKSVIVISAGFGEIGTEGKLLEEKVANMARKYDISLLGPNCLGVINTHTGLNASFAVTSPKRGSAGFISQSGALGTAMLDKALSESIGFSKFISLGNEAILNELHFLEVLKDDTDTKAIIMYVEKISDGRKFMEMTREITKTKPIVLIKAGRGESGQKAVMSHTGSLASDDLVFRAACKQSGVIVVDSIRELFNIAKLFEIGVYKPLTKLAILTNAGGPGVIASDLIDSSKHLSLVNLSDEVKNVLRNVLPSMAGVNNPVDIIGDALADRYESALKILSEEKSIDALLVILSPQMMTEEKKTAELLIKYSTNKVIIPIFIGGPAIVEGIEELKKSNLVNFDYPVDAIEALDKLAGTSDELTKDKKEHGKSAQDIKTTEFSTETDGLMRGKTEMLSFEKTKEILAQNGIEYPAILVKEKDSLREAMSKLGSTNISMKVASKDVIHKTDFGAVKLNLKTLDQAENAWDEIMANVQERQPNAEVEGMVIQAMSEGKEIIIGMKRDSVFGPTIVFGLGGIFTEALKDTSMRIAPVSKELALQMISEIRGYKVLAGLRGEKLVDLSKLANLIISVSDLSMKHPEIKEIDFNPVMVSAEKVEVVDVRVIV